MVEYSKDSFLKVSLAIGYPWDTSLFLLVSLEYPYGKRQIHCGILVVKRRTPYNDVVSLPASPWW
jgi:hypothetical protein